MSTTRSFGDETVPPGEVGRFHHPVGETYNGDSVEIPVSVVNGAHEGPTLCLTAALHGDELNGVKVLQQVASGYDPVDLHGTLVCLHVCNVPGYQAQQRDIPIYDQDLNRSFPGSASGTTASRMAASIYESFVADADLLLDFHTSTRNRTTMYHARADMSDEAVVRLARAFGANVILDGAGEPDSLRAVATVNGTPAVTVEMGKAHRFQPALIRNAIAGVESVLAEFALRPGEPVAWPGWYRIVNTGSEKTWLRADTGGLVDMKWGPQPVVREGEPICTVTDHFETRKETVTAPFDGLIVGLLENPVALPGHPLCHLVRLDPRTLAEIEAEIADGEFDGTRLLGVRWIESADRE
jgi:predicted deacylase